jgi:hypothetical protein
MMNVFAKTLIITVFIFSLGIGVGLWLDIARAEVEERSLAEISLQLTDVVTQDLVYDSFDNTTAFCNAALKSNLEFNDRIYRQGVELEKLEELNKLGPDTILQKKRYALLQTQFWLNAIKIREACGFNYDTVAYIYKNEETPELNTRQKIMSSVLFELKNKCGSKIMLVPIPGDMGLASIDTITYQYDIQEYPVVLINEKVLLQGLQPLDTLESHVSC